MTVPLTPRSPLDPVRVPGNHGAIGPEGPGVVLRERRNLALVSVMPAGRDRAALAGRLKAGLGLDLPAPNRTTQDETRLLAFAGLDKWMAVQPKTDGPALVAALRDALGDTARLADQSHGQVAIEIDGPAARDVLAKGVAVDLHPKVFAVGDAALVAINHVHVLLWRSGLDGYTLVVMRSFARDLWAFLTTMAGEYGYQVPAA
jgi:sarcosine oxidase subunit gamma